MKVGFNKKIITPKYPVGMAGYNRKSLSTGHIDDIEINTIVIESLGHKSIICEIDCIMLERIFCDDIKYYIQNKYNIPVNNVIISCIHTHSAPVYFKLIFEDTLADQDLYQQLITQTKESIDQAILTLTDCSIDYQTCSIEGLYGNRNTLDGLSDKSVQVLNFNAQNKTICSLINIAVHPTILDGTSFVLSSDLLGRVRKGYEERVNAPAIICNGTTGDVSTRFYRELSGVKELEYVSQNILTQMDDKLSHENIRFEYQNACHAHYLTHSDFSQDQVTIDYLSSSPQSPQEEFLKVRSQKKLDLGEFDLELISTIMYFDDVFIIGLPGDVVSYFGLQIKKSFPNHKVIIICYSDTYCNYLVNKEQYGKYFETFVSRCMKGEADKFVDKVIKAMNSLL